MCTYVVCVFKCAHMLLLTLVICSTGVHPLNILSTCPLFLLLFCSTLLYPFLSSSLSSSPVPPFFPCFSPSSSSPSCHHHCSGTDSCEYYRHNMSVSRDMQVFLQTTPPWTMISECYILCYCYENCLLLYNTAEACFLLKPLKVNLFAFQCLSMYIQLDTLGSSCFLQKGAVFGGVVLPYLVRCVSNI